MLLILLSVEGYRTSQINKGQKQDKNMKKNNNFKINFKERPQRGLNNNSAILRACQIAQPVMVTAARCGSKPKNSLGRKKLTPGMYMPQTHI